MKLFTTHTFFLLFASICLAQPGSLFTSFGEDGIVNREVIPDVDHEIQSILELDDHSILTVGGIENSSVNSLMSRYSKDGTLIWDVEFDASSQGLNNFTECAVIKDSSIYTASFYEDRSFPGDIRSSISLRKWKLDGTLDVNFGNGGEIVITNPLMDYAVFDMQLDSIGRFYLIGRTLSNTASQEAALVIRLNIDGSLDNTFASNGIYTKRWNSSRTGLIRGKLINDEIYLVGWNNNSSFTDLNAVFMKVKSSGSTDTNFGNNGRIIFGESSVAEFWSLDQQGPDHVLITGSFGNGPEDIIVRRYDFSGTIDNSFGTNGTSILDLGDDDDVKSLIVDVDRGIYLGASIHDPEDLGVIRLTPDGNLDSNFGNNGVMAIDVEDEDNLSEMVLLQDGNILLGGESDANGTSNLLLAKIYGLNGCIPDTTNILLTQCDTFYWNNEMLTTSGNYQQIFSSTVGCDSVVNLLLTITESRTQTISVETCDQYELNGETYSTSGTFTQHLITTAGCDSLLTIIVEITTQEVMLALENNTLTSSSTGDSYQWINCLTNMIIEGETSNEYTPLASGEFALIITSGLCTDTSSCEQVILSATNNVLQLGIKLMPNPVVNELLLLNPMNHEIFSVSIFNNYGREVIRLTHLESTSSIKTDVSHLTPGHYYFHVNTSNGIVGVQSFIKL